MSYYAGCVNNAVISGNNYHFQCGNYHLKSKIWIQGQAITSVTESALVKIQAIEASEELLFFASWSLPITHFSIKHAKFNLTFSSSCKTSLAMVFDSKKNEIFSNSFFESGSTDSIEPKDGKLLFSPNDFSSYLYHIIFVTHSNMTSAAPSFSFFLFWENKVNTTERGAAEVIFERVILYNLYRL